MNVEINNLVIAHTSCDTVMPDYLVHEDNTVMTFKTKEAAKTFVQKIAPEGFEIDQSKIKIMRIQ